MAGNFLGDDDINEPQAVDRTDFTEDADRVNVTEFDVEAATDPDDVRKGLYCIDHADENDVPACEEESNEMRKSMCLFAKGS